MKKAALRNYSFWRQWLPFTSKEAPPSATTPPPPKRRNPAEEVRNIASKFFPQHSAGQLANAVFPNVAIKTQILLACEKATMRDVPNQMLGKMQRMDDVLSYFLGTTKSRSLSMPQKKPKAQRPVNLSIGTRYSFSGKKSPRMAFQNFNDPEHAKFPSKKKRAVV